MAVDVGQTRMKMGLHGGEHELIKVMICPSLLCLWIYTDALGFPSIRSLAAVLINFKASCVKGQAQILTPLRLVGYPQLLAGTCWGQTHYASGGTRDTGKR